MYRRPTNPIMTAQKCYVTLDDNWRSEIEAVLVGYAPIAIPREFRPFKGKDAGPTINYSVDGLFMLQTMDAGRIYQLPLNLAKFVDEWYDDADAS